MLKIFIWKGSSSHAMVIILWDSLCVFCLTRYAYSICVDYLCLSKKRHWVHVTKRRVHLIAVTKFRNTFIKNFKIISHRQTFVQYIDYIDQWDLKVEAEKYITITPTTSFETCPSIIVQLFKFVSENLNTAKEIQRKSFWNAYA